MTPPTPKGVVDARSATPFGVGRDIDDRLPVVVAALDHRLLSRNPFGMKIAQAENPATPKIAKELTGAHRHARDQWFRAAQSIPLNIAEGNGKRSLKDRSRFLDIARGSALECAATQDVLSATEALDDDRSFELKRMLYRIVSMLTKLIAQSETVSESTVEYEYRDAEYEYDGAGEPEQ